MGETGVIAPKYYGAVVAGDVKVEGADGGPATFVMNWLAMASEGLPTSHLTGKGYWGNVGIYWQTVQSGRIAGAMCPAAASSAISRYISPIELARSRSRPSGAEATARPTGTHSRKWTAENQKRCHQRHEANKEDRRAYAR